MAVPEMNRMGDHCGHTDLRDSGALNIKHRTIQKYNDVILPKVFDVLIILEIQDIL